MKKCITIGVLAGFALVCAADSIEVPKDETVQLYANADYSDTTVTMNGGTLDQNGVTATLAGLTMPNYTTNRLVNTGDGSSSVTIGGSLAMSYGMGLYIESGSWIPAGPTWNIGKYGAATNIFEISGDDTSFTVARTDVWYFSDNTPAIVNFRGGRVSITGDKSLYLATSATGGLQWNVSGGTHEITDVLNFYKGDVELNISGGSLKPYYVRMANIDCTEVRTHTINQTGGILEAPKDFCLRNNAGSACNTFVNLDGGTTLVSKVYAKASSKGATSTLTADGGTLRPILASTSFIQGIDNVLLGEKGLTLNIGSYATTVPQDFTGLKEGASFGRIAKKGSATLKLNGAIAKGINVENGEANLEINGSVAGGSEIVALAGVVTINGTIGPKTVLTVKGGEIVIAPGSTIDPSVKVGVSNGTLRVQQDVTVSELVVDEDPATRGQVVLENGAKLKVYKVGLSVIVR